MTNAHAGKMLRAKVTYMANEDDPDTEADESTYPSWVEYTEVLTVSGDVANNAPSATQSAYEIRVQLAPTTKVGQPAAIVSDDSIEDLFFDSDGNDLSYSFTAVTPDLTGVGLMSTRRVTTQNSPRAIRSIAAIRLRLTQETYSQRPGRISSRPSRSTRVPAKSPTSPIRARPTMAMVRMEQATRLWPWYRPPITWWVPHPLRLR